MHFPFFDNFEWLMRVPSHLKVRNKVQLAKK